MKTFKYLLLSIILNLFAANAQTTDTGLKLKRTDFLSDNKKQSALDSIVEKSVFDLMQSPQSCGISIGIIKEGTGYFYNYGETKRDNKQLPGKNTVFEIGSITKTFCGNLLAIAVTEGKLKLEDDIRNYLPGNYPNLQSGDLFIQVKELANHTSGLPRIPENIERQPNYDSLNPYKNYDEKMILDYLKTIKLNTQPGKICEYSNFGMALLGIILEKIYNKSFEELVKEKIGSPNNMNSTAVNLTDQQLNNFANGYASTGEATPHWNLGSFVAAGGLKSSSADMINYLQYNMDEKELATKLAHQSTFNAGSNVALAWHIVKTKSNYELIWHNGGTFGFSSFCGFIKEKKAAIIILSNAAINVDYVGLTILKFLQK